jgi:tRNA A37 threonylcarbamoyltransferase TsaD
LWRDQDDTRILFVVKTILALETSCDETAVAILRGRNGHSGPPIGRTRPAASLELLASEVASQIAEHEKHGGIVPEIAARNHLVHAPRLLERTILDAKIDMSMVDVFAATSGPGLVSSLMIGASIAKGLAIGFGKPYLAINHLEGHLLSRELSMMLPAKHSIKSPRCSGLVTPAAPKSKNARAPAIRIDLICRAACLTRRISVLAD